MKKFEIKIDSGKHLMSFEERYDKLVGWLGLPGLMASIWLIACAVLLGAVVLNIFTPPWWLKLYMLMTIAMSAAEFVFYGLDKRAATMDKGRVPERRLLVIAALCGWPGAIISAQIFNHKTVKRSYRTKLLVIIFAHIAVLAMIIVAYLDQ